MAGGTKKRPNILFLLSDQHSVEYLGIGGKRPIDTPNLDALCAQGIRFENAYCQNPLCVPSRASMLTGKYSKELGIYENRHIMEANSQTLPRVLGGAGYKTCLVGKAHFNGEQYQGYAQRPYGDLFGQGHQPDYIRQGVRDESESGLEDLLDNSGPTAIPLPMTQTEICVAESVKWLQQYADGGCERPFFLSVNFDKPHFPYRPPMKYYQKYVGRMDLPDGPLGSLGDEAVEFVRKAVEVNGGWEHYGRDRQIHQKALAAYCGCVEWVDDAIGRILHSLDFLGLSENTIVVYASDHGEMAGTRGVWQKTLFFDQSAKVPLIIRYPAAIPGGAASDEPVGLIDLFPTLCDYAGCGNPEGCGGKSLRGVMSGEGTLARDGIFAESAVLKVPEHAGCMLRTKRYKYNYYLRGSHELYDLQSDPEELVNLVASQAYAEVARQMKGRIEAFWQPEEQERRYRECPMMRREKHFYLYSNQFISSDGTVFNAKP